MYILGITETGSLNPAAALIKDGVLVAAAEEERFNRVKHAPHYIPEEAMKYCLSYAGIGMEQVDYIAVGWRNYGQTFFLGLLENMRGFDIKGILKSPASGFEHFLFQHRMKSTIEKLCDGYKRPRWFFIPHHVAHAASAFSVSGFKESNIITIDGNGEDDSGLVGFAKENKVNRLMKISVRDSLGALYEHTTWLIGFKPHSEEGKTMGLAAYGRPKYKFEDLIYLNSDTYSINNNFRNIMIENYGPIRKKSEDLSEKHKDLAASVQTILEKIGVNLARWIYSKNPSENICLAGGVALNCDMNAKILTQPFVKNIFIQPAAHDGGCAIGAAFELYSRLGFRSNFVMKHPYWGPEYTNGEIEKILRESKVEYKRYENIEEITAKALVSEKIIGWLQGRMEIGPRALGGRSILAHPGLGYMKDKVNKEVKHRDPWRPFAPSILEEYGSEYLSDYHPSPFMLLTFEVKADKRDKLVAATHIDNTVRPQTVTEETNPRYYKMIKEFQKLTGIPAVLNTSFNDKNEPIVMNPKDALRTFYSTGLDVLVMGDFMIEKKK